MAAAYISLHTITRIKFHVSAAYTVNCLATKMFVLHLQSVNKF
uniref:Uncharacterized protein n=1 Tax=Arundo donax TaxID=35708 RepID=A0A0A9C5B3_ARUDO